LASEPISDVAILAVLVARANVQRQLQVAAREAWMREFREQVAQFLTSVMRAFGRLAWISQTRAVHRG